MIGPFLNRCVPLSYRRAPLEPSTSHSQQLGLTLCLGTMTYTPMQNTLCRVPTGIIHGASVKRRERGSRPQTEQFQMRLVYN